MIQDDQAAGLAEIFGVLGDPTSIKMISALMSSELCVCDLAALLGLSQSAVLPPVAAAASHAAGEVPAGGANRPLLPGRRPYRQSVPPGAGALEGKEVIGR